jgi:hypothetical protein
MKNFETQDRRSLLLVAGEAVAVFLTQGAVPLLCRPGHHFVADDAEPAYFSLHGFLRTAGKSLAKQ